MVMRFTNLDGSGAMQAGVEYTSPDQHGGVFGKVYRQYHGAKLHTESVTATGITKLVAFGGIWNTINCYNGLMYDGTSTIRILKSTDKVDFIIIGSAVLNEGWVDYTK